MDKALGKLDILDSAQGDYDKVRRLYDAFKGEVREGLSILQYNGSLVKLQVIDTEPGNQALRIEFAGRRFVYRFGVQGSAPDTTHGVITVAMSPLDDADNNLIEGGPENICFTLVYDTQGLVVAPAVEPLACSRDNYSSISSRNTAINLALQAVYAGCFPEESSPSTSD